ncbi:MAG: cell division protein ZapA [Thermodesulfovibrionales bacterium]|jgi:cell division protein ZapA
MGSVEVYILGQRYAIKGDEDPEYIQRIAGYVDRKIKEVCANAPTMPPLKAAIITALNMADELHKTHEDYTSLPSRLKAIEEKADTIIKLCD